MKNSKLIIYITSGLIIGLLLIIFVPFLYIKSFAEKQFQCVNNSKSQIKRFHILYPSVEVTNECEYYEPEIYELQLKRKVLILWETTTENADELGKGSVVQQNGDGDVEGAKNSTLVNDNEYDVKPTKSGDVLISLTDKEDLYEVNLIIGNELDSNYAVINGKRINMLTNVSSLYFDTSEEYLYYTKFKVIEREEDYYNKIIPSGKIFRYSIAEGKEELIYDFNDSYLISLRANEEDVVYALDNDEVGVISLDSKTRNKIDIREYIDLVEDHEIGADAEVMLIEILDVGEETGIIAVQNNTKDDVDYYRIDIDDLIVQK